MEVMFFTIFKQYNSELLRFYYPQHNSALSNSLTHRTWQLKQGPHMLQWLVLWNEASNRDAIQLPKVHMLVKYLAKNTPKTKTKKGGRRSNELLNSGKYAFWKSENTCHDSLSLVEAQVPKEIDILTGWGGA